jgi:hypothetical protein
VALFGFNGDILLSLRSRPSGREDNSMKRLQIPREPGFTIRVGASVVLSNW